MRFVVPIVSLLAVGSPAPTGVTPITELDTVEQMRHFEVVEVRRDFGKPGVHVALDAWVAVGKERIDAVKLWWSDGVDRYPFSESLRRRISLNYDRVAADHWRITIAGGGDRITFDLELEDGRPAAYTDVVLPDGRLVRHCRTKVAKLYARRFLDMPVGLHSMVVICTDESGVNHRAEVHG